MSAPRAVHIKGMKYLLQYTVFLILTFYLRLKVVWSCNTVFIASRCQYPECCTSQAWNVYCNINFWSWFKASSRVVPGCRTVFMALMYQPPEWAWNTYSYYDYASFKVLDLLFLKDSKSVYTVWYSLCVLNLLPEYLIVCFY